MPIRVLIVDDHKVVRQGLSLFLGAQPDIALVGEAAGGAEALALAAACRPDVVLMDLVMPMMDGIAATARMREVAPAAKVLILTSFAEQDKVVPAIQAGAAGYLLKDVEPDDLVQAIRRIHAGQAQLHHQVAAELMRMVAAQPVTAPPPEASTQAPSPAEELTPREREILRLIAQGKSNREIGADLFITERTVKTHITHLLAKLELTDRTQAAIFAMKHRLH